MKGARTHADGPTWWKAAGLKRGHGPSLRRPPESAEACVRGRSVLELGERDLQTRRHVATAAHACPARPSVGKNAASRVCKQLASKEA